MFLLWPRLVELRGRGDHEIKCKLTDPTSRLPHVWVENLVYEPDPKAYPKQTMADLRHQSSQPDVIYELSPLKKP